MVHCVDLPYQADSADQDATGMVLRSRANRMKRGVWFLRYLPLQTKQAAGDNALPRVLARSLRRPPAQNTSVLRRGEEDIV